MRTRCAAVVCLVVVSGCSWLPDPASRQAQQIESLWGPYTIVAAAVAALIFALLVIVVVRDRRRDEDEMPRQTAYNIPVEVAYIVVPVVVLAWLAVSALATQSEVLAVDPDPDVVIDVVAYRWQWEFSYRGEDVVVDGAEGEPELVLPAPAVVEFRGTSRDVVHSFWVPDFLFKRDLVPGRETVFQIDTLEPGQHVGECAEFCGLDHARMGFTVRTVTPQEYAAWLDGAGTTPAEAP